MEWSVPLADVEVDEEILAAARDVVGSGWWSMGPRVEAFEDGFRELCATEHAVAVANGTAALHLALLAAGCGPGDEVVLPSLNFVAAANAVTLVGATPVFCDVVGETDLNADPEDVARAIGPATKVVLVLHYAGYPCDLDAIGALAEEPGVVVIEDAAHAPGASWRGRPCGSLGLAGCFSFFSNKNLAVGEGGMIVTDDAGIAERLRLLRSHGMTTLTWDRHRGHASSYDVVTHGFNYRLDEFRAAIGLVQLRRLEAGNARRGALVERYREALDGVNGVTLPFRDTPKHAKPAYHLAVALLPEDAARDEVQAALADRGIQTSVHYPPIHRFTRYADTPRRPLPRTEQLAPRLLTLPLYPHLEEAQVELVAGELLEALGSRVGAR